jgi:hypothetical protein
MDRAMLIMDAIAVVCMTIGATFLIGPFWVRRRLSLPDGDATTYALRLLGAILAGFGLTLFCFSIAFLAAT